MSILHLNQTGRIALNFLVALALVLGLAAPAAPDVSPARAGDRTPHGPLAQTAPGGADPSLAVIGPLPASAPAAGFGTTAGTADDLAALRATLTSPGTPLGPLWTDSLAYNTRCEDEYRQNPDGSWSVRTVCYCDDECCGELGRGEIVSTGEWRPAAGATAGCCSLLGGSGVNDDLASPGGVTTAGDGSGALRIPAHAYLARGEFAYSATDLLIPGRGFDYRLVRTYKNQLDGDSPLGHNWDHSYNRGVVVYKTDSDGTIASYLLSDGFGRALLFSRASEGVYLSPPRFYMRLTRNPDGSFTVRDREGTQASFRRLDDSPAAGKITALADRNGNTMRFLYDSAGRLATVVDTLGRRIEYTYGPTGRLMEVSDFASRRVLFGYDAAGDLIAVTVVAKGYDPATAGRTTRYTYSAGHADSRANHNLLTITPPGFTAATLVNVYGTDPAAFAFDRLIRQEYSGGSTPSCCGGGTIGALTIAYEPLAHTPGHEGEPALKVTVTDDQGTATEYYYDDTDYLLRRVAHTPATAAGAADAPLTTAYTWNELDEVVVIVHPLGDRTEYRYDTWNLDTLAQGNLMQARQVPAPGRDGATITANFTYEPVFNQVASTTDAAGHVTAYAYDTRGNRTRETDALGNSTQHTYDAAGAEQSVTDPNGHTTASDDYHLAPPYADFKTTAVPGQALYELLFDASLSWDSEDALAGLRWRWDWEDDGVYDTGYSTVPTQTHRFPARGLYAVRLEVMDSDQLTATVAYRVQVPPRWLYLPVMLKAGRGGLAAVSSTDVSAPAPFGQINPAASATITYTLTVTRTDPLGGATVSLYDPYGNLLSLTDPRGNTTRYEYDAFDRLVRVTDPLAGTTTYTYDAIGNRTSKTDPNGNTWTYEYDGTRLAREIDPLGHATTYTYDARGNRTSVTDANGHTTTYTYDAFNRLVAVTDALGGVTRYAYDANGNRISETDKNGNATTYTYDGLNQVVEVTDPMGQRTTYAYNAVGNRVTIGAANGNVVRNTYDALGQLVQVDDNLGRMASYTYDPAGNRLTQTDGNGTTILYTYDASNRVVTETDAMNHTTRYTYDAVGNLILAFDRSGNTTGQAYDALGRRVSITSSLGAATLYVYDPVGNLLRITDANGHTTRYTYDAANHLIRETYADDTHRAFTYDGVGNLLTRTDQNGATTTYQYNATYSLTKRDYPTGPDDTFTYDVAGRMLTAERDGWLVSFAYDRANRVIETTQNGQTVHYTYSVSNSTRTVTYPGGRVITEAVDQRGRLLQIGDGGLVPLVEYTYDLGQGVLSRTYRNGVTTTYSYNVNSWITTLAHRRGGSLLTGFAYGYDWEGNRQFAQNTLPFDAARAHTYSEQYDYDSAYRLVGFKAGQWRTELSQVPS
jgi:YD repeat-containing protein